MTNITLTTTTPYGKGNGISISLENAIKNIILAREPSDVCTCKEVDKIVVDLRSYDYQRWNAICFSLDLAGHVMVKDGQWIVTKFKACNYLLWVID